MATKDVATERIGNALGLIGLIAFPIMIAVAFYLSSKEKEESQNGQ